MRSRLCCSGVLRLSIVSSIRAIAPNSVRLPVATTRTLPRPWLTVVPAYAMFVRSPIARVAPLRAAVIFSTGSDSPVSAASSTARSTASQTRPSAGTLSPAVSRTRSPGTSSRAGTSRSRAGAHDSRGRRRQPAERFQGPLRAVLLDEAQQRREDDDHGDDDRLGLVAEDRGQAGADEQDQDQDVLELLEQQPPRADSRRSLELVRAVDGQAPRGLRLVQSGARRGRQLRRDVVGLAGVPLCRLLRRLGRARRGLAVGVSRDSRPRRLDEPGLRRRFG